MDKKKKPKTIDFNFHWSWEYFPIWILFIPVEPEERINTGFEWVFSVQGLGFKFEWVKECKYVDVRTFRSLKRNHVSKDAI